eukprot:8485303-Pyramimonas_sp.AAC.1
MSGPKVWQTASRMRGSLARLCKTVHAWCTRPPSVVQAPMGKSAKMLARRRRRGLSCGRPNRKASRQ